MGGKQTANQATFGVSRNECEVPVKESPQSPSLTKAIARYNVGKRNDVDLQGFFKDRN
jgi:hypothetical protein